MAETLDNPGIAVLASGSGTTFEAFVHSIQANGLPLDPRVVIYDRDGAGITQVVDRLNATYGLDIGLELVDRNTYDKGTGNAKWELTDGQSERIRAICKDRDIGQICLQSFLSKVRGSILDQFGSLTYHHSPLEAAALNWHPGPLPLTRGKHGHGVHQAVHDAGLTITYQTVHVVSADYDAGNIFREHPVAILPGDSAADIEAAVRATERAHAAPDTLAYMIARQEHSRANP